MALGGGNADQLTAEMIEEVKNGLVRGGYELDRLNTEANGNGYDITSNYSISSDLTVYAIWKKTTSSGGGSSSTTEYYYYSFDMDEGSNGNTRELWHDGYEYIFAAITPNSDFSNLGDAITIGRFFDMDDATRTVDDHGTVCLGENDFTNRFVTIYQGSDVYTDAPYDIDIGGLGVIINEITPYGSIVFGPGFRQTRHLSSYTWFLLNTTDDSLYNAIEGLSFSGNVEVLRPNSNVAPVNILINSNGYMPIVKYKNSSNGLSRGIYWIHIDTLKYGDVYFDDEEFISLSPVYLLSQPIGNGPGSLRGGNGNYSELLESFKDTIDSETGDLIGDDYEEPTNARYGNIKVINSYSGNSTDMTVFTSYGNTTLKTPEDLTGQVPECLREDIEWFLGNYSRLGDYQGVRVLASLNSPLIFETGYIYFLPHSDSFDYENLLNNYSGIIEFFSTGSTNILFEGDTEAKAYFAQILSEFELIAYGDFGGPTWTMTVGEETFNIPVN